MTLVRVARSLGAIDVRSVARDPLLRWVLALTPGFGLFLGWVVPPATELLRARFGFDLVPYYPLLMSFLPLVVAGMVGTVMGFLLLDQRDDQTLTALLVTPMSLGDLLRYRMVVLVAVSVAFSWVTVPLAGLTATTISQLVVASLTAAPLAAVYALFLGSFAENKVQGFALAKVMGIVLVPCVAAYSVEQPWQSVFGLVPHYWPLKVYWLFEEGRARSALVHALIGLAWQGVVVTLLLRRLARVVRQ